MPTKTDTDIITHGPCLAQKRGPRPPWTLPCIYSPVHVLTILPPTLHSPTLSNSSSKTRTHLTTRPRASIHVLKRSLQLSQLPPVCLCAHLFPTLIFPITIIACSRSSQSRFCANDCLLTIQRHQAHRRIPAHSLFLKSPHSQGIPI